MSVRPRADSPTEDPYGAPTKISGGRYHRSRDWAQDGNDCKDAAVQSRGGRVLCAGRKGGGVVEVPFGKAGGRFHWGRRGGGFHLGRLGVSFIWEGRGEVPFGKAAGRFHFIRNTLFGAASVRCMLVWNKHRQASEKSGATSGGVVTLRAV
eukprot:355147-Chlamydomonas_euryale.AAC.5